jgi:hypothetical protein
MKMDHDYRECIGYWLWPWLHHHPIYTRYDGKAGVWVVMIVVVDNWFGGTIWEQPEENKRKKNLTLYSCHVPSEPCMISPQIIFCSFVSKICIL